MILHNRFLEEFASAELRFDRSLDLDLLTGLRVTAFARGALRHTERAKARDRHFLATAERLHDRVKDCFYGARCCCLRFDARLLHDRFRQLCLVHDFNNINVLDLSIYDASRATTT